MQQANLGAPARLAPGNIAVIGHELAIAWNDGSETYLALETLRRACPCTTCCGEPDALGNIERPDVLYVPASFELRGWQLVGAYAFQPSWGDGHDMGLFTFQHLRRMAGQSDSSDFVALAENEPEEKPPLSERTRVNWKHVLRWVGVLPGALLATILVQFPIHWMVAFIHFRYVENEGGDILSPGTWLAQISPEALERSADALIAPYAFVIAGALIAPNHRVKVAFTLGLGIMLLSIIGGITVSAYGWPRQILTWLLNAASVACSIWIVRKENKGTT